MHAIEQSADDRGARKRRGIPDSSVATIIGALALTNMFAMDISDPVLRWVVGAAVMGPGVWTAVRMYQKQ